MADRYESMTSLRESLEKIFDMCGLEKSRAQIKKSTGFAGLLEYLCDDRGLCRFMDTLESQAEKAGKVLEEQRLDEWNYQENERRLKSLENEVNQLKEKHAEEIYALRQEYEAMILNVIALRDNLLMRRDWIRDNAADNSSAMRLVEGQLRETGNLLKKAGVQILEDEGLFDSSCHTVVDTKPADDPLLDNQIAEVFRPGYVYKGKVLRGQEVILYVCQNPLFD